MIQAAAAESKPTTTFAIKTLSFADKPLAIAGIPGDPYFESIEHHLHHCNLLAASLFHHVESGATIVDIGANVGLTTALAHLLVKDARIISLEPSRVHACLVATVALNRIARQTSLRLCAGAADGEIAFFEAPDSSASHVAPYGVGNVPVPVRRVDTIVREQGLDRLDFIKIDVEGFEHEVLDGMGETVARFAPLILMEFNSFTLTAYGNRSPRAVLEKVVDMFGGFIANVEGLRFYRTEEDIRDFLHGNMLVRGHVDDILFSSSPERIAAFGFG